MKAVYQGETKHRLEVMPASTCDIMWSFCNAGKGAWNGVKFVRYNKQAKGAAILGGEEEVAVKELAPGGEQQIPVSLTAPAEGGKYRAYWMLKLADGRKLGKRVSVQLIVNEGESIRRKRIRTEKGARDIPKVKDTDEGMNVSEDERNSKRSRREEDIVMKQEDQAEEQNNTVIVVKKEDQDMIGDTILPPQKKKERKHKKGKSDKDEASLTTLEEWPEDTTHLFLDGNNMLFVCSAIRAMVLKRARGKAEVAIENLALAFLEKISVPTSTLVYDNTRTYRQHNIQGGEGRTLTVCSSTRSHTNSDDAIVQWVSDLKSVTTTKLVVTSDRELIRRVQAEGGSVMKPGKWMKFAASSISGGDVEKLDTWMDGWLSQ